MKKFIVFAAALLFSNLAAQAVNWQVLETSTPYSSMFIDTDSIRYLPKTQDYFYAVRFTKPPRAEQVVYLKSDLFRDYIGIIRAEDYDYQTYRPNVILKTSHVFMKPLNEVAFLYPAHEFVEESIIDENEPQTVKKIDTIIGNEKQKYETTKVAELRDYIKNTAKVLNKNWNPPKTEVKTKSVVNIDINADGTLNNYQFVTVSGDDLLNRSIINALEQSIPFENLSSFNKDHLFIQVTFERGRFYKNVK